MSAYATKLAESFSAKLLQQIYAKSIFPMITNEDYRGEVQQASKVNIPALARIAEKTYTGADLTVDNLEEIVAVLTVDQWKSFYFKVKTIDEYKSFIKDPSSKTINQRANERKKNLDTFILAFGNDVAAGNRVGTDYVTGTVAVDAVTGAVTGVGTNFSTAMIGKGFKAAGHTKWYRIAGATSTLACTIEDDLDDVSTQYTGGTIAATATYVVQANTKVQVQASTLLGYIMQLKTILDNAEVPDEDRCLVVPPVIGNLLVQSTGINMAVPALYEDLTKRGFITEIAGFKVFNSTRVAGNNTDGYRCLAIHPSWLTFADRVLEAGIEEDLIGNFGAAFKDLYIYGAKVADERRKFAAEGLFYV